MKTPYVSVVLPHHIDRLIDLPWTRSASLRVDRALVQAETRYELEFRGVRK